MDVLRPSSLIGIPCRAVRWTRPPSDWMASATIPIPEAVIFMPNQHTEPLPLDARFWSKVEFTDTCWLWQAGTNTNGYGTFSLCSGHPVYAHRLAFMLLIGPIPAGLELDHLCRVRRCVNPLPHTPNATTYGLEPVTPTENWRRGESTSARHHRQTHCIHGHPLSGPNLYVRANGGRVCRTCLYRRNEEARVRRRRLAG